MLARAYPDLASLAAATSDELEAVDEIGPTIANSVRLWLDDPENRAEFDRPRGVPRMRSAPPRLRHRYWVARSHTRPLL